MKKRPCWILCLFAALICSVIGFRRIDAMQFNGLRVLSGERLERLTENLSMVSSLQDTDTLIELDGKMIPYDRTSNTFYVSQSTKSTEYAGIFRKTGENYTVYIQKDAALNDKQTAVAEGHKFKLWFVTEDAYATSDLIFTGLPTVCIRSDEGRLSDHYTKGDVVVQNPDDDDVITMSIKNSSIEVKTNYNSGTISFKLYRDGYSEERNLQLLGLGKRTSWKLYPVHNKDDSAVREMLASYVWNNVCETDNLHKDLEYAEVIVDGAYRGLYYLAPKTGKGYLELGDEDRAYELEERAEDGAKVYDIVGDKDVDGNWLALEIYESMWDAGNHIYDQIDVGNYIDYHIWLQTVCGIQNSTEEYCIIAYENDGAYKFSRMPERSKFVFGIYPSEIGWQSLKAAETVIEDEPYERLAEGTGDALRVETADRWRKLREGALDTEVMQQYIYRCEKKLAESGYIARSANEQEWAEGCRKLDEFVMQRMSYLDNCYGRGGQPGAKEETASTKSREENIKESSDDKGTGMTDIGMTVAVGSMQQRIRLYRDENVLYAFLPAAADTASLAWAYDEERYRVMCAEREAADGDMVSPFIRDGKATVRITDTEDSSDAAYQLCLMQSENLPAIFINTQSGAMDWVHMEKDNREPGEISCIDENGMSVYTGALEKITGRGNSSWTEDKKSYNITLEREAGLAGMPAAAKWVLQANALDATRMRNKLTYDMAQDIGLQYAIDSAYVDLWLNGEYAGNYLLCEKIEVGENRVDISSEDGPEERTGRYVRDDEGAWWEYDSVSGARNGYLLEFNERIEEEETGYFMAGKRQVEVKSPAGLTYDEYKYIQDYALKMTECLENAAWSDEYLDYIDSESWSLVFLLNELSNDTDANRHSVFYYKDADTKMHAGPVWDYDIAWGNDFLGKDVRCSFFRIGWYGTLYDNDFFYRCITANYEKRMKPVLEKYLAEHIDVLCGMISGSVKMDDVRWAHSEGYTRRSEDRDWERAVDNLKDYMRERMECFDDVWLSGEVYHRIFLYDGDMVIAVTYVRDGDVIPEATLNYVAGCLAQNSWRTEDGETYDTSTRVQSDMNIYAQMIQTDESS